MKQGDIVLTALPQSNGEVKLSQFIEDWDEQVRKNEIWFEKTGLKTDSIIRLSFLSVVPAKNIAGSIGRIPEETLKRIKTRLSKKILT